MALGAVAFAYAYSQNGVTANTDEQQTGIQNMQTFFESNNVTLPNNVTMPWWSYEAHAANAGRRSSVDWRTLGECYAFECFWNGGLRG